MKPPEPQFLIEYRKWLKAGPPHCCHTCEMFDNNGVCTEYDMTPPTEFINEVTQCKAWIETIPF